jgi:hypothetical protein
MDVPLPRASSKRLINFFTFHISIFFSASFVPLALMIVVGVRVCASRKKFEGCRAGVGGVKRCLIGTPVPEALRLLKMCGKLNQAEEDVEFPLVCFPGKGESKIYVVEWRSPRLVPPKSDSGSRKQRSDDAHHASTTKDGRSAFHNNSLFLQFLNIRIGPRCKILAQHTHLAFPRAPFCANCSPGQSLSLAGLFRYTM